MNKLFAMFVIIAVVLTSSLAFAQDDTTPDVIEYIVTAEAANFRVGAGTGFGIVTTVYSGDSLLIYDEEPEITGWLRVYRSGEDDAYIADFLVERAPMRFYPTTQEPVAVVSGRGTQISDVFDLPQSAYRIDAVVQDNALILSSIVVEGDCRDDTIFNELDFDVNRLVVSGLFVSRGCSFIFETDNVDGEWQIEIRDLLDQDAFMESLLVIENGTSIASGGRTLTMATELPEGIWTISAIVDDNAFILRANVLLGECDDTSVFNELDFDVETIEPSTVYRSEEDGCTIFWETDNVDGDWEITFEQIR